MYIDVVYCWYNRSECEMLLVETAGRNQSNTTHSPTHIRAYTWMHIALHNMQRPSQPDVPKNTNVIDFISFIQTNTLPVAAWHLPHNHTHGMAYIHSLTWTWLSVLAYWRLATEHFERVSVCVWVLIVTHTLILHTSKQQQLSAHSARHTIEATHSSSTNSDRGRKKQLISEYRVYKSDTNNGTLEYIYIYIQFSFFFVSSVV